MDFHCRHICLRSLGYDECRVKSPNALQSKEVHVKIINYPNMARKWNVRSNRRASPLLQTWALTLGGLEKMGEAMRIDLTVYEFLNICSKSVWGRTFLCKRQAWEDTNSGRFCYIQMVPWGDSSFSVAQGFKKTLKQSQSMSPCPILDTV